MSRAWPVVGKSTQVELTFTTDTAAYADGDLLADVQELANVMRVPGGLATLQSLHVLDESDVKQPLDVVFFDTNQSMGTENAAPNISDANASRVVGVVPVVAGDYKDIGGASVASLRGVALMMKAAAASTSLWVALVSRGTGTYGATALKMKFTFAQD